MRLLGRRKVRCPDGTVKYVYRHVDDAFPLELTTSSTQLKANLDAAQELTAGIESSYSTTIQGMLYSISQKNESLMMSLRALYVLFQGDPCANAALFNENVVQLVKEQSRLNDVSTRLHALATLLQGNQAPSETILTKLLDIVQLVGSAPPEVNGTVTALAIEDNRVVVQKWISTGEPPPDADTVSPAENREEDR